MKKIKRSNFFVTLGTAIFSTALLKNLNFFSTMIKPGKIQDHPVKVEKNPLSVSRNNPGVNNVRK
jgi:hypothetical protein